MPAGGGWLSLKILNRPVSVVDSTKTPLLISIPKKIVRLATQRNRIKRLIREVFRKENIFDDQKIYQFRVVKHPKDPSLNEVRDSIITLVRGA